MVAVGVGEPGALLVVAPGGHDDNESWREVLPSYHIISQYGNTSYQAVDKWTE